MIRFYVLFVAVFGLVTSAPKTRSVRAELAEACDASACVLPNCRCSSTDIPGGLDASEIPQLVLLTFDDAVTAANYEYYQEALYSRTNPDGCAAQATFFMSHEYTDYTKVHDLHAHGHEIALHSITHEPYTTYWDNLDVDGYIAEFGGERELIAYFANIPEDDIQGLRIPLLQLAGNKSFEAMESIGLKYDCSWPTQAYMNPPLWPYTLDYRSKQDCPIGACPSVSLPGVWVQPMVMWTDNSGYACSMVDACIYAPTETEEILDFLKSNFHRHYDSNKAPFGFYVHAAWFLKNPNHYDAYLLFLDYLQSLSDVYIVSIQRALEWVQNPKSISQLSSVWSSCPATYQPSCIANTCALDKNEETRYMTHCRSECPSHYPWLNNPLGA